MPWIYKITYPNGKIYIGSDMTDNINYWGSPSSSYIRQDFSNDEIIDMTIRRELLFCAEKGKVTRSELIEKEMNYIRYYESNNPLKGYNKNPKFKG